MVRHMSSPEPTEADATYSRGRFVANMIVLPGIVVASIVFAAMVFAWLLHPGGDVDTLVESLEAGGRTRWSASLELATLLQADGKVNRGRDPLVARRLSELLEKELEIGAIDEDNLRLREYLCRAMGEFEVAEPLPTLIVAAETRCHPADARVQRAAIEAMAVLVDNIGAEAAQKDPALLPCLTASAQDDTMQVRCAAAFTLGVVGSPLAEAALESLLADEYPEIRYNAATGLARHGNPACLDVLVGMLDPDQPEQQRGIHRTIVQVNALRAAKQLIAASDPSANLSSLAIAVERLVDSEIDPKKELPVRVLALEVQELLKKRPNPSAEHQDDT